MRAWSSACASGPRSSSASMRRSPAPRPRPTRPTSPRRGFWPRRATTSCSRSTPRRLYATTLAERSAGGDLSRPRRQCRCLARRRRGDPRRAARHFAARFGRDEAGDLGLPHRRALRAAARRVRADGAREGPRPRLHAVLARHSLGPPAAAAPASEPRLQCGQVHAGRPRRWSAAGAGGARSPSRCSIPGSASRNRSRKPCSRSSSASTRAPSAARGLGLGLSIVERIARVLDHRLDLRSEPGRGSHFSLDVPIAPALASAPARAPRPAAARRPRSTACVVLAIDNEPTILEGMEALADRMGLPRPQGRRRWPRPAERASHAGAARDPGRLPPRRGRRA